MIATLTLNPALDHHIRAEHLKPGEVNRIHEEQLLPGGKGINVSAVLHHLGVPTKAFCFTAGLTGQLLEMLLAGMGIPAEFLTLPEGSTRLNVKLHAETDTELNGSGAPVPLESLAALMQKLSALQAGDTLVLAGSVPPGLPETVYADIMQALQGKGIRFAVDTTGALLRNTLAHHPFVIKPNHHELGELFGVRLNTPAEAERYARKLQDSGAQYVLVSMGERGSVLVTPDGESFTRRALRGNARNTTGAGDSMLAGFLTGYERFGDAKKALHMGIAAASASVFSGKLAEQEETEKLFAFLEHAAV